MQDYWTKHSAGHLVLIATDTGQDDLGFRVQGLEFTPKQSAGHLVLIATDTGQDDLGFRV